MTVYILAAGSTVLVGLLLWLASRQKLGQQRFAFVSWMVVALVLGLLMWALFAPELPIWVIAVLALVVGLLAFAQYYYLGGDRV